MKRKVLQISHSYNEPFFTVARQYQALFDGTDIQVVHLFLKGEDDPSIRNQLGHVIFWNRTSKDLKGLKRGLVKDLNALCQQTQFEFCIAHRYKAIFLATQVKGLFVVGVAHIVDVFEQFFRKRHVMRHKDHLMLLGVSKAIRDDIRKSLPRFPEDRIQHLYNSLNFAEIRQDMLPADLARMRMGYASGDFVFANVGRLNPVKDQSTLVRAFALARANMPRARLAILGEGNYRGHIEELIRVLGLEDQVTLKGMVANARSYLRGFDVFVLSSRFEGLPVALLEAYAAEIPCIASRCTGSEEAIEGVGLAFDVGDVDALARQMLVAYRMTAPERAEMVVRMNRKIKQDFDADAVRRSFWSLPYIRDYAS